jgi:hypothetical protein
MAVFANGLFLLPLVVLFVHIDMFSLGKKAWFVYFLICQLFVVFVDEHNILVSIATASLSILQTAGGVSLIFISEDNSSRIPGTGDGQRR